MHIVPPWRISTLLLAAALLAACVPAAPAGPALTPTGDQQVVLELQGLDQSLSLTLADLQAMPGVEGWGGTKSSAGVITAPQQLKGVSLEALAEKVGGLEAGMGVSIVAKDGYAMSMSYEQIASGDFITYDPGTGNENQAEGPLQVIVAYNRDGRPIPADEDGPLRLFIVSPKNDNVVDGHWTVKWVSQIRLKPMAEEWSLYLEGARTEEMDRNSFESCSAPGCHQATWSDDSGNEWTGVPLFYLAGRVDDGVIHEDRAYDEDIAEAGYTLELFAADGYNVSIDSARTIFNKDIFVASLVNGEPLEEKNFPLRLVGAGLEKGEMIGQLAQIVLRPNEGVAMPSGEAPQTAEGQPEELVLPEGAALMLTGKVVNRLVLKMENLQAMNPVEIQADHPKSGASDYRGVRLNDLLNLAAPDASAATLVITASDGYAAEADLAEVRACDNCLIAFADDGTLSMVMPGMQSNFWVKDVNFLQVK